MLTILFSSNYLYSQGNNWKLDGNNNSTNTSFLGTTHNFPLQFRTNNQARFTISNNGNFTFHTLSGNGNALMLLNNNGEAYRLNFSQNNNDVLTGNGTWQSINTLVPQYWQLTNAGLYTTQPVVVNNTITATGIQILHKIEADTIKGIKKVDINGNITLGEDGAYKGITAKIEDLNINSKPGYDFNTILNANTNGNVGIGTSNPTKKLDVNGDTRINGNLLTPQIESSLIKTDTLRLTRISHLEGDSVIYIGDSTLIINTAQNSIKWTSTVAVSSTSTDVIYPNGVPSQKRGLSIGNGSTIANGINSIALGLNVSTSTHAHHAVIIGSGPNVQPAIFTNNIPNSLMIGFNSNIPTLFVSSSNGINTTGNIGIATSNPIAKLHIVHQHTALRFERNGYKTYDIRQDAGNSLSFVKVDNPAPNAQNPIVLYLGDTGNVAIGNLINPQAKLHIMHKGRALRFEREAANYPVYEYQQSPANGLALVNVSNNDDIVMFYNSNSSVGIGTTSTGSFKLAVEGVIGARELKLTNENPWPDYVFEPNYNIMPIDQVAAYIKVNKHLPGIPSAQEIKENNGLELGEMQRKMLEKIEELYLYVIMLEEENKKLNDKLESLNK